MRLLRGLILGCHPGPALLVTAVVTLLALALGRGWAGGSAVFLAVLTGQLSTGWANDGRDAVRDVRAGRGEKPVVRGLVTRRTLWIAAAVALVACVPLSLIAGGFVGGAAHLVAVASAWVYNLWLKTTVWSWLPYLVSFAMVPPFLTLGLDPPQRPALWSVGAFALLGVGAHLANGIPDIEGDRATDSGGVVSRLGGGASANLALLALLAAAALLVGHLGLPASASILLVSALVLAAGLAARSAGGRRMFPAVLLLALLSAVLLSLNAGVLVAK